MALKRNHLKSNTRAYARVGRFFFEVIVGQTFESTLKLPPSEHAYGWKPIWLAFGDAKRNGRPTYIHLTGMTGEELDAFKRVIDLAYEDAKVIVADLDEQAYKIIEEGCVEEVPLRALASAPPFYERAITLPYEGPIEETA